MERRASSAELGEPKFALKATSAVPAEDGIAQIRVEFLSSLVTVGARAEARPVNLGQFL